jgi:hypothetical protein
MTTEVKIGEGVQQIQKVNAVQSPQYVSVYANNVQVTTNYFDTAMIFSEMLGAQENVLSVEQKVRVVISLPQLKLLALSLIQQIDAYEKRFTAIQLSPEVVPPELLSYLNAFQSEKAHEGG